MKRLIKIGTYVGIAAVSLVVYIIAGNLGNVGYFCLIPAMIFTIVVLVLHNRELQGRIAKIQVPAAVDLEPLETGLADHAAKFHLGDSDWQDLLAKLPYDLSRRLDDFERFMRLTEGLNLRDVIAKLTNLDQIPGKVGDLETWLSQTKAAVAAIEQRLTALEAKPAPATVDLAPVEQRLAAVEAQPVFDPQAFADLKGTVARLEAALVELSGKVPDGLADKITEIDGLVQQLKDLAGQKKKGVK